MVTDPTPDDDLQADIDNRDDEPEALALRELARRREERLAALHGPPPCPEHWPTPCCCD